VSNDFNELGKVKDVTENAAKLIESDNGNKEESFDMNLQIVKYLENKDTLNYL